MGRILRTVVALGALSQYACAGGSGGAASAVPTSPTTVTTPQTPTLSLAGLYSGGASDSSGSGVLSWNLSTSGTAVSGGVSAQTTFGAVTFTGTVTGTLAGTTLTFSIAIPAGGLAGAPACSVDITGTAEGVTASTISGTYAGTSTCSAPFNNGRFTLNKRT